MLVVQNLLLIGCLFSVLFLSVSCESPENGAIEQQEVKISELEMNNTVHDELQAKLVRRIENFHSKLSEVNTTDLETTLTNFKRDQNPESEVEIWETIAAAYMQSLQDFDGASQTVKNDIYNLLLFRSMMPSEAVL